MDRDLGIPDRPLYHQKEGFDAHYHFEIYRELLSVWNSTAGGYYRQLVPTRANLRSGMPHQNNPSACIESSTRGGCAAGRNNSLHPPGPHGSEDGRQFIRVRFERTQLHRLQTGTKVGLPGTRNTR